MIAALGAAIFLAGAGVHFGSLAAGSAWGAAIGALVAALGLIACQGRPE